MQYCQQVHHHFETIPFGVGTESNHTSRNVKPKCRGRAVDPFVKTAGASFKRVSEIDGEFRKNFEDAQYWCKQGYGVKLINLDFDPFCLNN